MQGTEDGENAGQAEQGDGHVAPGATESSILVTQSNLAALYDMLGRKENALKMSLDVYSVFLKIRGEEDFKTLQAANNYADFLDRQGHFEEAKALLRRIMPVARRVLGKGHGLTLKMRLVYADALYRDDGATLDDLREAVTTLEEAERIARRVLGGTHPTTEGIEDELRSARVVLAARETPSPPSEIV